MVGALDISWLIEQCSVIIQAIQHYSVILQAISHHSVILQPITHHFPFVEFFLPIVFVWTVPSPPVMSPLCTPWDHWCTVNYTITVHSTLYNCTLYTLLLYTLHIYYCKLYTLCYTFTVCALGELRLYCVSYRLHYIHCRLQSIDQTLQAY